MSTQTDNVLLMNPHTGTVQSAQDWADDGYTTANAELIEVKAGDAGGWLEA